MLFLALHSCRHSLGSEFREPQTSLSEPARSGHPHLELAQKLAKGAKTHSFPPLRRTECSQGPQYGAELWGPSPTSRLALAPSNPELSGFPLKGSFLWPFLFKVRWP